MPTVAARANSSPQLAGGGGGLGVEVPADLDVVGHEAGRRDHDRGRSARRERPQVVAIPQAMDDRSGPWGGSLYSAQRRETARLVTEQLRGPGLEFDLVWQSRSGPPQVPWPEPDVNASGR